MVITNFIIRTPFSVKQLKNYLQMIDHQNQKPYCKHRQFHFNFHSWKFLWIMSRIGTVCTLVRLPVDSFLCSDISLPELISVMFKSFTTQFKVSIADSILLHFNFTAVMSFSLPDLNTKHNFLLKKLKVRYLFCCFYIFWQNSCPVSGRNKPVQGTFTFL